MKPTTKKLTDLGRKQIFALFHKAGKYHDRKDFMVNLVGVMSIKDLTEEQGRVIATELQRIINHQYQAKGKMGRKIIYLCCEMGMTKEGKPDYERINKFIANIGDRNPRGEQLWGLNYDEMLSVLNQVETVHRKEVMGG